MSLKQIVDDKAIIPALSPVSDNSDIKMDYLEMESDIALFKAKFLELQQEAYTILNAEKLHIVTKEKKLDKTIKKSKQLLLEVINFIFNSPLKKEEFILNNQSISGRLGYFFNYFASQYGIPQISSDSLLTEKNAILHNEMSMTDFITVLDKYYYEINNDRLQ